MVYVDLTRTLYRVSDFLSWQRAGTLELSPSFQRRPVWPPAAKSYFIDTVVRGLPVPIIFLREQTDIQQLQPKRQVVDGQQRIRTLLSFIEPSCLPDFRRDRDLFTVKATHNPEIANKAFAALPEEVRRRILDYQFSAHILPSGTDDRQVLQIFARMNATGVKLNGQELRNAQWFGEFKTSMYELASEQLERWRTWRVYTENDIARMLEVEATSDLALMILRGISGKSQRALDALYKEKDEQFQERRELERRFRITMDAIDDLAGRELPALAFSGQTLFYTLFAFVYDLLFGLGSPVAKVHPAKIPAGVADCLRKASHVIRTEDLPTDLARALRGATSHAGTRMIRLQFLKDQCLGA